MAQVKTVIDEASGVSETVFENGLTLLVKPLPDDPVVTTMIWYAVGSRDEGVGETGLSHYLEHMLFKGTDKYPVGAIDKVTQLGGGSNNASTRNDATEYHFSFPADRWEAALEIESDRMRNSAVVEKEFQNEKKVVLNELWIGLDDPENVLQEAVESAAFPVGRYHHPVIGWQEDVETTTRERMLAYYHKHYGPERATLVVVGGVDRDRVIQRTGELFRPIPRGTSVRYEQKEPPLRGETRLTFVQDTQVPRLIMAFRSVPILDPTEPLLDVASSILSGDKTSRLEKALIDTRDRRVRPGLQRHPPRQRAVRRLGAAVGGDHARGARGEDPRRPRRVRREGPDRRRGEAREGEAPGGAGLQPRDVDGVREPPRLDGRRRRLALRPALPVRDRGGHAGLGEGGGGEGVRPHAPGRRPLDPEVGRDGGRRRRRAGDGRGDRHGRGARHGPQWSAAALGPSCRAAGLGRPGGATRPLPRRRRRRAAARRPGAPSTVR